MTDLRKLAERMALKTRPWQRKDVATKVKVFLVDDFERILREHHGRLAVEIVRVLRGFDYVDHVEDEAAMFDEILLLLEGGAGRGTAPDADERPDRKAPSAPHQPNGAEQSVFCKSQSVSTADPIYQTNEVSNGRQGQGQGQGKLLRDRDCDRSDHHQRDHDHRAEQVSDENEQKRSDLVSQTDSDDGGREHRSDVRDGDGARRSGEVSGVADDRPMVTNYDAEAEVRARLGVWVGPGDRVEWNGNPSWQGLVLNTVNCKVGAVWVVWTSIPAGAQRKRFIDLCTPTGQPVLGFRDENADKALRFDLDRASIEGNEQLAVEVVDARARIAELERELEGYKKAYAGLADDYQRTLRERDEARAERDRFRQNDWTKNIDGRFVVQTKDGEVVFVRLDNATIAEIALLIRLEVCGDDNCGCEHLMALHLRDWRDGKLKEASDDKG